MAELKANQEREAVLLQEQLNKLEKTIQEAKRQEAEVL
jgi:TATA-binding protein-associated factor Taf7